MFYAIDHDSATYRLTYRVGQKGIWYMLHPSSKQDVAVETKMVAVSQELAIVLVKLMQTAVVQTAYPKLSSIPSDAGHLIVAAYQPGIGLRSGSTSAIGNGPEMTALVDIINRTRELAIAPTNQQLLNALLQKATQLLAQLENR